MLWRHEMSSCLSLDYGISYYQIIGLNTFDISCEVGLHLAYENESSFSYE